MNQSPSTVVHPHQSLGKKRKTEAENMVTRFNVGDIKFILLEPVSLSKLSEWQAALQDRAHELNEAIKLSLESASTSEGGDPLLFFKWNHQGLQARVEIASQNGMTTSAGNAVANSTDLIESISNILIAPPNGGVDLGNHHDIYQFLPAYNRDLKMNNLMIGRQYLRHHGQGWVFANDQDRDDAMNWPDIVEYLQIITITKANAAVGPVDVGFYFND